MIHTKKLTDLVQNMGIEYSLHFYALAGMGNLNQKLYDFSQYHLMLLNKQAKILPTNYIRNEEQRMQMIFPAL